MQDGTSMHGEDRVSFFFVITCVMTEGMMMKKDANQPRDGARFHRAVSMVYNDKIVTSISRRDILLASVVGVVGLSSLVSSPRKAAAESTIVDDLAAPTPEEAEQVSSFVRPARGRGGGEGGGDRSSFI